VPILLDTSIYVAALRQAAGGLEADSPVLKRWGDQSPLWLSSVVLEELYAGANSPTLPLVQKLERDFDGLRRVLTPSARDWAQAGNILRQIGHKYGFEETGRARMTNDALIATSASRQGIAVVTVNRRDFERLAEFCSLRWEIWAV